jgi:hypothetical protein
MTGPSLRPLIASSLALALLSAAPDRVDAGPGEAGPLRVHLECEAYGRTKACPEFFTGFIDEHDALLTSPRAVADVVLYVHESAIASTDRLHLRFTSKLAGAPPVVEFDVDVDSRTDDDAQLAALRPAFLRGIALYVAARRPELVETTLAAPTDAAAPGEASSTTPWGVSLSFGGNGSWTSRYQNYSGWSSLELSRLTAQTRSVAWGSTSRYLSRQPPLVAPDGSTLSLDSSQWSAVGGLKHVALLSPRWSIGAATSVWTNDDKGQYRYGVDADVGLEWDKFAADDPRGNSLAIAYVMGYQVEAYNLRNELGERSAHYPTHRLSASGSFRRDKITYGLDLSVGGAVLKARRRHSVSAAPSVSWTIGSHVDLSLDLSITKREVPGPHPDEIDNADYELISRSSYAEPVSIWGSFNVRLYWERTNGARNDRLDSM